jgi:tRNA modification GTPase
MYWSTDTIAAVASAPGGAARGIVRLSGPTAHVCAAACFQPADGVPGNPASPPSKENQSKAASPRSHRGDTPRFGTEGAFVVGGSLQLDGFSSRLPCEAYFWPAGRSYTGQAAVEFHTLGSPPLLEALLQTLCARGARLAQPGEFTLRAFLNGRIDLTQAEAVLGAIDAAGDEELEAALKQLAGGLSDPLRQLRQQLLELLARLEAGFDFAEEDIAFITPDELRAEIRAAEKQVSELRGRLHERTLSAPAIGVVFVGRPNTGKSSLFNALIRRTGAIVSPQPGTTRDYLTAEGDLDGVQCTWIDTAGIRPEGKKVAEKAGEKGSELFSTTPTKGIPEKIVLTPFPDAIRLLCIEAGRPWDAWEQDIFMQTAESSRLVVLTKMDLCQRVDPQPSREDRHSCLPPQPDKNVWPPGAKSTDKSVWPPACSIPTSSLTGEGLEELRKALRRLVRAPGPSAAEVVPGTAARCEESLRGAAESLRRAAGLLTSGNGDAGRLCEAPNGSYRQTSCVPVSGEELIAAEIRWALEELGRVVGAVYTDDLLDRIFSRFCVGK